MTTTEIISIDKAGITTIERPAWSTSGISSGTQALNRTAGLNFWTERSGTASPFNDRYFFVIPGIEEKEDIGEILLNDSQFKDSIERAREQMRVGVEYFSHDDIFGE